MVSRETSGSAIGPPDLPPWLEPVRASLAEYADILVGPGIERGLLGPREADKVWDRHIINCAVVAEPDLEVIGTGARIADIGSGAGLPGLVWALTRPDVSVVLIESLLRRVTFLTECITALEITDRVQVVRARAEEASGHPGSFDIVTARAVAPLGNVARWAAPLLLPDGALVAIKGESAQEEVTRDGQILAELGLTQPVVVQMGQGVVDPPTTVVMASLAKAE
ncbi:MAG: 16S rRNA (guanine(527)-N(7))-methyltransferase RsmG [Candidatus Nanopelagicales bacterium]|jgi:16S rRNA (guanine527-N7)-methyltransferase|nr:16S rRNA (guanine(527)-N(7))-methyltransferase RsmG [Candidatus Nanopelagicales bacterium]MCH9788489.1 16S rRNA (guanine(527)-N(7))-methyltransferase RsmG [Actinomycetes bacterium]MCH1404814.1 16S rRNA (guanine(527)-N(7))-methyltransferase RsmG [Candidatus Nanopelagicales bacterium]MCH1463342.1 16S rRNA (guanine(527)-N(7))-methyltransferase RsmG [Candidatus Nanopelagicales bacterium]MCH9850446.1 16S rRNA (guanine(527)-N(7))-methyltransferase RsmG [Actinomycetes bacterium]